MTKIIWISLILWGIISQAADEIRTDKVDETPGKPVVVNFFVGVGPATKLGGFDQSTPGFASITAGVNLRLNPRNEVMAFVENAFPGSGPAGLTQLGLSINHFFDDSSSGLFIHGLVGFGWANMGKMNSTTYNYPNCYYSPGGTYDCSNYSYSNSTRDSDQSGFTLGEGFGYEMFRTSTAHLEWLLKGEAIIAPRGMMALLGMRVGLYFAGF